MIYNGTILLNNPSFDDYPIRGVDVSTYQGNIDWEVLSAQNISFAFIKATEGSSLIDPHFHFNYSEAQKQGISIGAYHFFSYDSPAETQAENFINAVTPFEGMLPPVIDLEFYGDYANFPPNRDYVDKQLGIMINAIEKHYGLKPIIYATEKSYQLFLSGAYEDYDIWIRDVYFSPKLSDGKEWTLWQYTNRAKLKGYSGREKFIDLNVFTEVKKNLMLFLVIIQNKLIFK
jgi:lysozyme